jgi:hypothetical protein
MQKGSPIILSELADEDLQMMHKSVEGTLNSMCEECTPPPEVFQLYQNIIDEMEARNLV